MPRASVQARARFVARMYGRRWEGGAVPRPNADDRQGRAPAPSAAVRRGRPRTAKCVNLAVPRRSKPLSAAAAGRVGEGLADCGGEPWAPRTLAHDDEWRRVDRNELIGVGDVRAGACIDACPQLLVRVAAAEDVEVDR